MIPSPGPSPPPGDGSGASMLEVGDRPLLPHILPPRLGAPGLAWPALPLPSKLHGLARIVFVLARGLMCQSQDRVSLAPCAFSCPKSLWRTGIPGARGGCSWWGCSGRGWKIWHLCAPSPGYHGDRTSLVVIAWSWPVVQAAHRKGDTAPGMWLLRHRGQCASPVPPASTLSPPTPSPPWPYAEVPEVPCQLWQSPVVSHASSEIVSSCLLVLGKRERGGCERWLHHGVSAGCQLLLGRQEPQDPSGGHMGVSSSRQPCRNSSLPVPGRAAPGPQRGTGLGTVGRTRWWCGLGVPAPQGTWERWSGAAGG